MDWDFLNEALQSCAAELVGGRFLESDSLPDSNGIRLSSISKGIQFCDSKFESQLAIGSKMTR